MLFFFYAFKIIPFIKVKILFKNERVRERVMSLLVLFFLILGYCSLYNELCDKHIVYYFIF